MARQHPTHYLALLIATGGVAGCGESSLVEPGAVPDARREAGAAPGSYLLSFLKETRTGLSPAADAEPVGTYLVLKSEVRDASGNLAQVGSVTYEFCWRNGDYAPKASCDAGSGSWKRHWAVRVDPIGSLMGFGACSSPRTIGFRFSYTGQGSGIASEVSQSRDFTWTAGL